jgi:Tol biopolymer transport system component
MIVLVLLALSGQPLSTRVSTVRAAAGDIWRVSVSSSEAQANSYSRSADISADGRYVVFRSEASNLVAGDTNGAEDIFLRDQQAGETARISISSGGAQANDGSYFPAISADGRFVAFDSDATNLVGGDTNGVTDIFVRDRQTGLTSRVSVRSDGAQGNDVSDSYLSMSADGRFIAFNSDATNLAAEDTNSASDIFVHDRQTGVTERISLDSAEAQANGGSFDPSMSADGRYVAFSSGATNLAAGDTNGRVDIFVRDRLMGVTTRVSVNSNGVQVDRDAREASISGDGRFVAFSSDARNMLDEEAYGYPHVYIHDRQTGATTLASITPDGYQMVGWSTMPDLSSDGRYLAFEFEDRGDGIAFTSIHVHDRLTGLTTRVSGSGGSEEDSSFGPVLSADGHFIAFASYNKRLVANDTNGVSDVFRLELPLLAPITQTYASAGTYDGWVLEASEDSGTGLRIDDLANTFLLGDANNDQQYRSVLHFETGSLPNNAIITHVTLKIRKQGLIGTNPFTTHGSLLLDVRKPYFDSLPVLQPADFQATADQEAAGTVAYLPGAVWFTAALEPASFSSINLAGPTQFRLRFALDDNNDNEQDAMKFYSGNAAAGYQPVLTIEYFSTTVGYPSVHRILRADPDPSSASSVRFTVAFSEPVSGVDASDFALTTSGMSGAAVSSVTGSGDTYTVTVNTGTGSGTIRLDVVDDDSIRDANNNPLGGSGPGNGFFIVGQVYTITGPSIFADVPASHPYFEDIEILYANGLTGGCNISPLMFCPDEVMNRAQSAVFMLRGNFGAGYNPPEALDHLFADDWSPGTWAEKWAEAMYKANLSAGCSANPLQFCPWEQIPREQAVIFALRLKYGMNYTPPPATGTLFADMTDTSYYATKWAEQAYIDGLIPSCGTSGGKPKFCPQALVTRGLAAYMIVRAKNLSMP